MVRENVLIKFIVRISHVEMLTSTHVYTKCDVVPALKAIVDTICIRRNTSESKKKLTGALETYGYREFVQVV